MKISTLLTQVIKKLNQSNIVDSVCDAEFILSQCLNIPRAELYLNRNEFIPSAIIRKYFRLIQGRAQHIPVAYLFSETEFMGLKFKVTPAVLIPRPETERLVEETLRILREIKGKKTQPLKILDLGTGSGCIAVSLAKFINKVNIYATDITQRGLVVAKFNARLHQVSSKIKFVYSNWYQNLNHSVTLKSIDIIVSNPPYIAASEFKRLPPEVKQEPRVALYGGVSGTQCYDKIFSNAGRYLKSTGILVCEIGYGQEQILKSKLGKYGLQWLRTVDDYAKIHRVLVAKFVG